jgi:hypothetical protein
MNMNISTDFPSTRGQLIEHLEREGFKQALLALITIEDRKMLAWGGCNLTEVKRWYISAKKRRQKLYRLLQAECG